MRLPVPRRFGTYLCLCGILGVVWCQATSTAWSQPAPPRAAADDANPRQQVMQSFERTAPAVGEPLPDVAAYDAHGKPLRLSELRGHYTVLVFGCLT